MSRQAQPGKWRSTYLREECFGTAWRARVGPLERACQRTESASMKAGCLRELTSNWDCSKGTRPITHASSDGRCNTCLKFTRGSLKSQSFSWTLIQAQRDLIELRLRVARKVCSSREVLP